MEQFGRKRRPKGQRKTACSKCGEPADRLPQRYCKKCHTEYMEKLRQNKNLWR